MFSITVAGRTLQCRSVLGYGVFGIVFKAFIEGPDIEVAVKFVFKEKYGQKIDPSRDFLSAEKLPLTLFDTGCVIRYYAVCPRCPFNNSKAELIIMELADYGNLAESYSPISGTPVVYSANHARRHTVSIIEAMHTLRVNNYVHRDLKPDNLLLTANGKLVLGDIAHLKYVGQGHTYREVRSVFSSLFRLLFVDSGGECVRLILHTGIIEHQHTVLGPVDTAAPELLEHFHNLQPHGKYDCEKSDVWSVAGIHFQLRSCLPFWDQQVLQFAHKDFTEATEGL